MLDFQRALTTTVNDIEHIEGTSYTGVGIVKVFFQPGTDIRTANSQVTAIAQTVLKQMPPDITPPLILNYNASTVPIIQLALAGKGMSEQAVFDIAINTVRTPLVTVPGRRCRSRSAASTGRSRSTSTRPPCRRAACRPTTSPMRWPPRT